MLPPGFQIGQMRPRDVMVLDSWATTEGWNPGLGDLALAYALDPDAFIALYDGAELVGAGSVFRHNDSTGFMGLFIMHPDHRGRGLGAVLWKWRRDRLVARLGKTATIGIVIYIAAMWIAGVMQGLMWRAINPDGTLTYTFVESVKATYPFYVLRLLGGLLYLGGMLIMLWNTLMTVTAGRANTVAIPAAAHA